MTRLSIANFNLNNKYILSRDVSCSVLNFVRNHNSSIININNIGMLTMEKLLVDEYLSDEYNIWCSKEKYITMIKKSIPLCYFRFFQLDKDLNFQLTDYNRDNCMDGSCFCVVINIGREFITIINANINSFFYYERKKEFQNLQKILCLFSDCNIKNIYRTDRQIVFLNFHDLYEDLFSFECGFSKVYFDRISALFMDDKTISEQGNIFSTLEVIDSNLFIKQYVKTLKVVV